MGEPRTWTIWKRPGSVDGMIRGPVADAVEVVERFVLRRVEEERYANRRSALAYVEEALRILGDDGDPDLVERLLWKARTNLEALSASHAPAVDEGGEDG